MTATVEASAGADEADAAGDARFALIFSYARTLFVNGEATDQTVASIRRLGSSLGLRAELLPRWGELQLQPELPHPTFTIAANPTDVEAGRIVSTTRSIEDIVAGHVTWTAAKNAIAKIAQDPPLPTWFFAFGAVCGAVALSVIFGIEHWAPVALILLSAGAGAFLRRALARHSKNVLLQPFCAALLAGIIGGIAVRYQLSSSLRLVAVAPCMILVPGPHVLNGAADLIRGRVNLGAARLVYAGLVIAAICVGLLLGLALLGASLPVDSPGRSVPLWQDVVAAAVAVFAYSIFYSTPLRLLPAPVIIGALAHALRWVALVVFGANVAAGALIASMVVGILLTPIADRMRIPFAPIGFACVVSMLPGVYLFRMASGLIALSDGSLMAPNLLAATFADGLTALNILIALSIGVIVPNLIIDRLWLRRHKS
jgi:uncharacterized membrane protein YjjP (DUF1212 family)